MTGFRKDILGTLLFRGVTLACNLSTSIITARYLLPAGRGILATLTGTNLMAVQVVNLGLVGSTAYFVAKRRERMPALLALAVLHSVILGAVSMAAGLGMLHFSPEILDGVSPLLLIASMLSVPCMVFLEHARRVYLGLKEIQQFNLIELLLRASIFLLTVAALIVLGRGLDTYVWGLSILYLLLAFFYAWRLIKRHSFSLAMDRELWRGIWGFGLKSYVTNVLTLLVIQVDVYIINYLLGSTENGYYSVVVQLANLVITAPTMIGMVVFSWVANDEAPNSLILKAVAFTAAITTLPLVLLAVWGKTVIVILFGSEYLPALTPLRVMLPGIFLLSIQLIFGQVLVARGLPMLVPIAWFSALLVKLALAFYFIPKIGIAGASLSTTAAYFLVSAIILTHFVVHRGDARRADTLAANTAHEG